MVSYEVGSRSTGWLLAISIALFLILDLSLLGLNFRITKEVSEDALVINLAGRQRMLTQRMSKVAFQIDPEQVSSPESKVLMTRFHDAYWLFTKTLDAFYYGGEIRDAELNTVTINRINIPEARDILFHARKLSLHLAPLIKTITDKGLTGTSLAKVKKILVSTDEEMLGMMNRLTVIVEKNSKQKTRTLRMIQLVTFCLALLNFAEIIRLFRKIHNQSKDMVSILDALFQSTNAALIVFSADQRVLMSNQFACHFLGYSARELKNMNRNALLLEGSGKDGSEKCLTIDGKEIDVEVNERTVIHKGNKLSVLTIMDISTHVERERNDPLTGIQNRHALSLALDIKSEQVQTIGGRFACFFLDLDNFKVINDQYGHEAGDNVLKCFAGRLKHTLRDSDLIYRFGGDEFIILVDLTADNKSIDSIFQKLDSMMRQPFSLSSLISVRLSLSAGVAVYPDDTTDTDELLNMADRSMYRTKNGTKKEIVYQQIS
ncbi:diguanylate cyclase [Vibrio salinus]|uniref:diguanylate cyclase n=1 Tax=Vibrio salinus TaxID=2899784 RepID=UPI001E49E03B|nr:diguanylate cyclase [Vibrio salinus]MCE0494177.1 diguanylate cyclase [Vibrio salinus]